MFEKKKNTIYHIVSFVFCAQCFGRHLVKAGTNRRCYLALQKFIRLFRKEFSFADPTNFYLVPALCQSHNQELRGPHINRTNMVLAPWSSWSIPGRKILKPSRNRVLVGGFTH